MIHSNACTVVTLPKAPRGGKGSDKRFAAYDAECARIAATWCGAVTDKVVATQMTGRVGIYSSQTAVSVYQGSRCLGQQGYSSVDMWITDKVVRAARFTHTCG